MTINIKHVKLCFTTSQRSLVVKVTEFQLRSYASNLGKVRKYFA